jgi:glycosyltransferase involved in cell wall biosynthesis
MQLSVVITTFKRPDLLKICLDSLREQTADKSDYEVIVVDNAGDQACANLVDAYPARYVYEEQTGHSYARNRGLKEAASEWALYFDDDTIIPPDLIRIFLTYLPKVPGAAFGGRFNHWYLEPPPAWLVQQQGVGTFPGHANAFGILPADEYLIGCFFGVKVDTILSLGGFDPELGMKGKEVGWADETELQYRLRMNGFEVYYAPELVIEHLVQPWKCTFLGQLKFAYSHGVGSRLAEPDAKAFGVFEYLLEVFRVAFIVLPVTLLRWGFKHRNWYWQNAVLRVMSKLAFATGRLLNYWKIYAVN